MSRDRREQRTRSARNRRAAASYLLQLAWLEGFPIDGARWHRLDTRETLALDGALIAKTRRAAQTVLREHRDELAERFDVERWWAHVDRVLRWCSKPTGALDVLDDAPPKLAREVRAIRDPQRREAAMAAAIAWATEPKRRAHAIAWLADREVVDDLPATLALAKLAEVVDVDALIALLAVDAPHSASFVERGANLARRIEGHAVQPTTPGPRSGAAVRDWLGRLWKLEPRQRCWMVELVDAARLVEALDAWRAWELAHAPALERLEALAVQIQAREAAPRRRAQAAAERDERERALASVAQLRASMPEAVDLQRTLDAAYFLAVDDKPQFAPAALRLLRAVRETPGRSVRLLQHCLAAMFCDSDVRRAWLWDALAAELEAGAPSSILVGMPNVVKGNSSWEWSLFEHAKRPREIAEVAKAAAALARSDDASLTTAERAAIWLGCGLSIDDAVATTRAMREVDHDLDLAVAKAAHAMAPDDNAARAARATQLLAATHALSWRQIQAVMQVIQHAVREGAAWMLDAMLPALVELGPLLGARTSGRARRWPALTRTPDDASWIARYPEALAPALRQLASVCDDAEDIARRRLATDLPDPADLARERAALEAKPRTPSIAKRLDMLARRIATPPRLSAVKIDKLADKLVRAAAERAVARFVDALTRDALAQLGAPLARAGWPVPLTTRGREILVGLAQLSERDRALATRLLLARHGAQPWDLRDEPRNLAWRRGAEAAGLDLAPWLDDAPVIAQAADAKPITLALTSDPLEVFAMGAHFETCLSPGGVNFFSVLANAADLNKRVLYIRRGNAVLGRCLLALTDEHALLTFEVYAHDHQLALEVPVAAFVRALARRMGTRIATLGQVRTLVAHDWYDDGARDLVGRFAELNALDPELETIAPHAVAARLTEALAHALDDITLPLVLARRIFARRPELLAALAPAILASNTPAIRVRAASLAFHADDAALADRLLGPHEPLIDPEYQWHDAEVFAALRPSRMLAQLRATRRQREVRSWLDETGARAGAAAIAMAALHRPQQARALFERAVSRNEHFANALRARLNL